MKSLALLVLVPLLACSNGRRAKNEAPPPDPGCTQDADCTAGQVCFQAMCVDAPSGYFGADPATRPSLKAAPTALSFGGVEKTLPITLTNDGGVPLELSAVRIAPEGASFKLESMGDGPFWLRPGRSRDVLVTFRPSSGGATTATLSIESPAPTLSVALSGN